MDGDDLLFSEETAGYRINGDDDRKNREDDDQERPGMRPLVQFVAAKNPDEDNDQHLESHAGIACIGIKRLFLWVGIHLVLPVKEHSLLSLYLP